uniref:Secreted protein n=1 Tax=Knipowitschia caucasica TaxID=637954 RepID=A0AAV2KEA6_KNICA
MVMVVVMPVSVCLPLLNTRRSDTGRLLQDTGQPGQQRHSTSTSGGDAPTVRQLDWTPLTQDSDITSQHHPPPQSHLAIGLTSPPPQTATSKLTKDET